VSVLALSSMANVRIERQQATSINARQIAHSNARSGVELALQRINSDPSWRSNFTNGVETTVPSLGNASTGSISWSLSDSDGDLDNSDGVLRLKGIGRVSNTVQVSSVQIRAGEIADLLRSYDNTFGAASDDLSSSKWWGQYFKPNLPADVNGWVVTSVQVRIKQNAARWFRVRLYGAGGGNVPSGTVIESIDVNSSSVPFTFTWYTIPFAGSTWLEKDQAVCVALETTSGTAAVNVSYKGGGVSASDSALVRGDDDGWDTFEPEKALHYRVNGTYTTSDNLAPVAGTWDWDVP
jgi:hypothetical protein